MLTFSQLVDNLVSEVKRPDLTSDIVKYLNQTVRECHISPDRNAIQFYRDNAREIQLTATSESNYVWDIPKPQLFQAIASVNYPLQFDSHGQSVWPTETRPGRHLSQMTHYFYRVAQSVVFAGAGGVGGLINVYWYEYPGSLPYLKQGCRPMEYDSYGNKIYAPEWIHDHARDDADVLCTNWMIDRWADVISEGVRAKVYKRVSDDSRARTCYSLYQQLRQGLVTAETALLF